MQQTFGIKTVRDLATNKYPADPGHHTARRLRNGRSNDSVPPGVLDEATAAVGSTGDPKGWSAFCDKITRPRRRGGTRVLEMRTSCERCGASLAADGTAFICSYECTFCADCSAGALGSICPNCNGELVARPRRRL
jgi:hypothetical protein